MKPPGNQKRKISRLLALADHAHQRSRALRELAKVVNGTYRDAELILWEYRKTLAELWLRDEEQPREVVLGAQAHSCPARMTPRFDAAE